MKLARTLPYIHLGLLELYTDVFFNGELHFAAVSPLPFIHSRLTRKRHPRLGNRTQPRPRHRHPPSLPALCSPSSGQRLGLHRPCPLLEHVGVEVHPVLGLVLPPPRLEAVHHPPQADDVRAPLGREAAPEGASGGFAGFVDYVREGFGGAGEDLVSVLAPARVERRVGCNQLHPPRPYPSTREAQAGCDSLRRLTLAPALRSISTKLEPTSAPSSFRTST